MLAAVVHEKNLKNIFLYTDSPYSFTKHDRKVKTYPGMPQHTQTIQQTNWRDSERYNLFSPGTSTSENIYLKTNGVDRSIRSQIIQCFIGKEKPSSCTAGTKQAKSSSLQSEYRSPQTQDREYHATHVPLILG